MNILIGVTGSIAAYKAASVISVLVEEGHDVRVIMTENAKKFITPTTLAALSGKPVYSDENSFYSDGHINHIELSKWAHFFCILPCTYNTLNKIKCGIADNMLTDTIAPYIGTPNKYPVIIFPAMNSHMYNALQKEAEYLNSLPNYHVHETATGKMACGSIGKGKLLSTRDIINHIMKHMLIDKSNQESNFLKGLDNSESKKGETIEGN